MSARTRNLLIGLTIVSISTFGYFAYMAIDDNYKQKIKAIEKERDSLEMEVAKIEYRYDSLEKVKQKVKKVYLETENKLKSQENETDAIPGIVATYTNRMLDSILTNYRFVSRTKGRNSNRP